VASSRFEVFKKPVERSLRGAGTALDSVFIFNNDTSVRNAQANQLKKEEDEAKTADLIARIMALEDSETVDLRDQTEPPAPETTNLDVRDSTVAAEQTAREAAEQRHSSPPFQNR
jgi:hypothetical protein